MDIDVSEHLRGWRERFEQRPYAQGRRYDDYEAAYRYGTLAYIQSDRPREWSEVENELHGGWAQGRGDSRMEWQDAEPAVRDAWERLYDPARFG